ncbi:MAG TPA: glycosyltransferase [Candidatus Paceibacterota bacterium]|nr:glycosyltransferase [Candidatus Paceibacterota bacterium]
MDDTRHISFVIPAYNCADTLAEAVESIYNGNFEDGDEVIVIDDASTDTTPKVIEGLRIAHPDLMVLTNEQNKGCPATRNVGIHAARNGLIFNLDADNILAPGSVAKLKTVLTEKNADVAAFSEYHYFKGSDKKVTHKWIYPYDTLTLADLLASHINPGPGGNFLYTKASWEKVGGYWEYGKGLHEAWGFTLKQLAHGARMVVPPHSYYLHRYGVNSLFDRESKELERSSLTATKMLEPFLDLLDTDDAAYIRSEEGSRTWFETLPVRPIRLASHTPGRTGYKTSRTSRMPGYTIARNILRRAMPRSLVHWLRAQRLMRAYRKDFSTFKTLSQAQGRGEPLWDDRRPELFDNTSTTPFDAHYIYHPAWAARVLHRTNPSLHIDISSTLTFSSILSAFIPVRFYDYRPAPLKLSNFESLHADLTALPFQDGSIASLSCMHTIEHIGLGRYGDPLDPNGDRTAIAELIRVLAPGGNLLFVTPVGKPRVRFNAHRIYSYRQIMEYFNGLELVEFSLLPDDISQGIVENASQAQSDAQNYGCGCFWFRKR